MAAYTSLELLRPPRAKGFYSGLVVKTKNTSWTSEEEAILVQSVRDGVSPARLSVRLRRSEGAVKRRIRELGLSRSGVGPERAASSHIRVSVDPIAQVQRWLSACRSGDLGSCLEFYASEATLECACSGPAVYAGRSALKEYWRPKLQSNLPGRFSLIRTAVEGERVTIDYLSYEGKPVRMILSFDETGAIAHSKCGPHKRDKARGLTKH